MEIPYSLLADLVSILHGLLIVFTMLIIFSQFRGNNSISEKFYIAYIIIWNVGWIGGALIFHTCPITKLEKYLRGLGQEEVYQGHFLQHYFNMSSDIVCLLSFLLNLLISVTILLAVRKKPEKPSARSLNPKQEW